jgi:hypothetical protein
MNAPTPESNTRTLVRVAGLLIGGAVLLFGLMGLGLWLFRPYIPGANKPPPSNARQTVTINASDGTGGTIDPINVWATYTPRGRTVARVHGGDTVTMLRRDGDGVLIETSDGTQGWVTYWFINGLKKE